MDYRKFITTTLSSASKIATKSFGKVAGITKAYDNNQVLTSTDLSIGKYIISEVRKKFPNYNIIDEEAGSIDNESKFTWVIDPIDGTSNFSKGVQLYGILLGLLDDDKPVAGGLALPSFKEIYVAQKRKGSYCNNERIEVSKEKKLLSSLVAYGIDGHQENPQITIEECNTLADLVLNIRNLRSSNSAYDIAMVARGNFEAYLNRNTKIWDNVAEQIIIEEAGGMFTDFFGKPIDYSNPLEKLNKNFTICAAPIQLHKQLQKLINKK